LRNPQKWWQRWDCDCAYIRMAKEDTELPISLNEGERQCCYTHRTSGVRRRESSQRTETASLPIFTGKEAVEQFIQKFQEVMEIAQWPPRVALLKLRMALRDKAKPYGTGLDIHGIFASLRARLVSPPLMRGPVHKDCGVILTRRYKGTLPR